MNRFETFTGSVLELNRYVQRLKDLESKPLGLHANHIMCLYYLGKSSEGLTVTQLAQVCREDKAAVSRCVAQLLERKLVAGNFPEGKRSYRTKLYLTEAGKQTAQSLDSRVEAAVLGGGSGLTDEQRAQMYFGLETVMVNLKRYIEEREKEISDSEVAAPFEA